MSSGSNTSNSALKGAPGSNITLPKNPQTSVDIENSSAANASISLTPRFTTDEKEILYSLFHLHEEVIDIKYRKKQKAKYSVREAWQQIVDGFNEHPIISVKRNLKQIQKFWLNARLRKQYPYQPSAPSESKSVNVRRTSNAASISPQAVLCVPAPIKCEPEYTLTTSEAQHDESHNTDEYEEIELQASSVNDPLTVESLEDSTDTDHIQQQQDQHQQIQQQMTQQQPQQPQQQQQHQQHQQHQHAAIQTQQISVDQISAEKLTLNDLLHFKNARPREDIILQIKHPEGTSITLPSPTRISIPQQQNPYNQIIGEIKTQPIINEIKHQPQTPHIQVQHYQQQQIQPQATQQLSQQQQQQQQQQQIQQQFSGANSTYCTYTTQHLPHVTTPTNFVQASGSSNTSSFMVTESFEEKINYFKLKEAELRYKEVQIELEKKRIDLSRIQEELKHQKEMHRLQVEEMRAKIRILNEEEKQLRNKES